MPIDPSIPLQAKGVQLESPINQLGMMNEALKYNEMNRSLDEQNKLNEYLRSGVDLTKPEARQELVKYGKTGLAYGKALSEQEKSGLETKKLGVEIGAKQMEAFRERMGNLAFNPSNANIQAHLEDAVLKGEITPQEAQQRYAQTTSVPLDKRASYFTEMGVKTEDRYRQSQENMRHATASGSALAQAKATMSTKQESEFEKTLGGKQAEALIKSREAAQDAKAILETNEVGRKILNSGVITGSGADFFVGLNQALKTAGIDAGYGDAAANSQAYGATMASNVGKLIKQYGAGTGLSDADREFATKAAAGSINMDEKAIRRVLDINDRAARNIISEHNKKAEGIKTNVPLKVEMPGGIAPMYATNGKERIVSNDGGATWQPVGAK